MRRVGVGSDWISLRKGFLQREQKVSLETGSVRKEWISGSLCGRSRRVPYKYVTKCGDLYEGLKDCLMLGNQ